MANSGCYTEAKATEEHFLRVFREFDYVVTLSGSCTHHVRNKFTAVSDSPDRRKVSASIYDLVEFLYDVLQVREFPWASFEHNIALHTSCSAIRGLRMASMSERVHDPKFSKPKTLLQGVRGIEFADFERVDECCGFGGTFSVREEAVAAKMGYDKIRFISNGGARFIVSSDMSCLMHLEGCAERVNQGFGSGEVHRRSQEATFLHIAEILNGVSA